MLAQVLWASLADASATRYIYDEAGRFTGVVRENGATTDYVYDVVIGVRRDSRRQQSTDTSPKIQPPSRTSLVPEDQLTLLKSESPDYDAAGNLISFLAVSRSPQP